MDMNVIIRHRYKISIALAVLIIVSALVFAMRPTANEIHGETAPLTADAGLSLSREAVASDAQAPQQSAAAAGQAWQVRCSETEAAGRHCEAFQRLVVRESGQRLVEFAIGFPPETEIARAVIILPLGILVNQDTMVQVDERDPLRADVRYCTPDGCFATLDLDADRLASLRDGRELLVKSRAQTGQNLLIKMSLQGISAALNELAS